MFENRSSEQFARMGIISIVGEFIESNCMRWCSLCQAAECRLHELSSCHRQNVWLTEFEATNGGSPGDLLLGTTFATLFELSSIWMYSTHVSAHFGDIPRPQTSGPAGRRGFFGVHNMVILKWIRMQKNKQTNCVLIWKPQNNMKWNMFLLDSAWSFN